MKIISDAVYGLLAGFMITLGATAYLLLESTLAGALMFTLGLFAICTFGWNLFTGKVCYSAGKGPKYIGFLAVVWLSNFAGAAAGGLLLRFTRLTAAVERANALCDTKLGDSLASVFLLAICCNVLIYIAVEGYRSNPHELGKYLSVFFGVTVFVVCGFEHCIANMFYITAAWRWSGEALVFILVNTAGNVLGGLLVPALSSIARRCSDRAAAHSGR